MSLALSAGVTGLQAHQKMLDVAGNNLANVNTTAFKASNITFSELLSETIKKASQPTSTVGGTNPQQMGTGVGVAGISPNMTQGSIVNTGNPLDLALEGEGYFVVSDGQQSIFTRAGAFAVDANSIMVDPATGYRVQRIGAIGESDGFQIAGVSDLYVPYGVPMPAQLTSTMTLSGNLSSDATLQTAQTQVLGSNVSYTAGGTAAVGNTLIADLTEYTGTLNSGTITFSGYKPDGTALGSSPTTDLTMDITATTTLNDVLTWLNTNEGTAAIDEQQTISSTATGGTFTMSFGGQTTGALTWDDSAADIQAALEALSTIGAGNVTCAGGPLPAGVTATFAGTLAGQDAAMITVDNTNMTGGTASIAETTKGRAVQGVLGSTATASLLNGQLRITDTASGYSKSDLVMTYSGDGTLTMPGYFEMLAVGGEEVKSVNIMVYDSQGGKHVFSGAFVRTNTANTWDMVLTSMSGNIDQITILNRRVENITFDATNGYYTGVTGGTSNPAEFVISFAHDPLNPQTIALDFGSVGQLNGLTQFAGNSTAIAKDQDGYEAGQLSTVSVNNGGIVIGAFSNGIKKDIGAIQISLFQNTSGLESIGNGYYTSTANSGVPVATQAMSGGAGSVHGGALEKSNSDVATQFVSMIQAQNGFQANARTIRVANDILRELSSLIR
ncbi:MAG: flagellar hook-basal body complex protein [Planctomycetes bacterium]|nr:flagellar hook-basal body complex protein [Planctomycetota bacterium]MBL7145885.1 flagellar hook-basal body complex protein [Phycisphaerae bacterium]